MSDYLGYHLTRDTDGSAIKDTLATAEPRNAFLNNSAVVARWKDDADRFYVRDYRELPVVRGIEIDLQRSEAYYYL